MGVNQRSIRRQLLVTLGLSSAVSVGLLAGRIFATQHYTYWFLVWNLVLAWIPLGLAWWLVARLRTKPWLSFGSLLLTILWLGFLPNAFYIASDIIHLTETGNISVLYDVVMFLSFTFNGFVLGYLGLYGLHQELKRRLSSRASYVIVAGVLLLCSFAIYLGRYLRWNSWDILINPAGLIFDVSEPFINPSSHPQVFTTTAMIFVLLMSIYAVSYQLVKLARQNRD
jgi:uncharacterized membrane protein